MNNGGNCAQNRAGYPENEGTVYRGTVNSGYYKNPNSAIDDALWEAKQRATKNELKVFTHLVSELTTNIIHAVGI